jgi:hypothetical protein
MGAEAVCTVRVGGEATEAKVLLETDEVIVRQPLKLKLPFRAIVDVSVDGDDLVLVTADHGRVELHLGNKTATRWAAKIEHPPTLADKLGLTKPGDTTKLVGVDAADLGTTTAAPKKGQPPDVILYAADSPLALGKLPKLGDSTALWVVFRKGGAQPTEHDVIAAGRAAGLTDTKVARWSDTHTALRFVNRTERRPAAKRA